MILIPSIYFIGSYFSQILGSIKLALNLFHNCMPQATGFSY